MVDYDKENEIFNEYNDVKPIKPKDSDADNNSVELQVAGPTSESENGDLKVVEGTKPKKRFLYLEVPIFLINFASNLTVTVYTNQLLFQSCTNVFHFNVEDCEPMLGVKPATNTSKHLENQVQPYVSNIILTNSLITALISAILCLFAGPWADKFGRRPVLLITFSATVVSYVIITILAGCSANSYVNPWTYILYSVPLAICGGSCSMMTIVYCCISDWASAKDKARRMFYNDAAISMGLGLGTLASSYLFAATNTTAVFGVSLVISFLALVYVIVFVQESLKPELMQKGSKIKGFFDYKLVIELVRTCIAKRAKYERLILWFCMASLVILNFITQGENNVFYLFLVNKFELNFKTYSTYNLIRIAVQMVGSTLALELLGRVLKLSNVTIVSISMLLSMTASIVKTLAQQFWAMYVAMCLNFMSAITGAMLLAVISILISQNEAGKFYALSTVMQTIVPLASSPLYTAIYNSTIATFPGLYNVISASLYFVGFLLNGTVFGIQHYSKQKIGQK